MGFFADLKAVNKEMRAALNEGCDGPTIHARGVSAIYGSPTPVTPKQSEKPPTVSGVVSSAPVKEVNSVDEERAIEELEQRKTKPTSPLKRHHGRTFLISALFGAIWQGTRRR